MYGYNRTSDNLDHFDAKQYLVNSCKYRIAYTAQFEAYVGQFSPHIVLYARTCIGTVLSLKRS